MKCSLLVLNMYKHLYFNITKELCVLLFGGKADGL